MASFSVKVSIARKTWRLKDQANEQKNRKKTAIQGPHYAWFYVVLYRLGLKVLCVLLRDIEHSDPYTLRARGRYNSWTHLVEESSYRTLFVMPGVRVLDGVVWDHAACTLVEPTAVISVTQVHVGSAIVTQAAVRSNCLQKKNKYPKFTQRS